MTWPTWLIIQALPSAARRDYARLTVESVVFYPRELVATDGPQFDQLSAKLQANELPWSDRLDANHWRIHRVVELDDDYVSLKFPIGEYAAKISQLRKRAEEAWEGERAG